MIPLYGDVRPRQIGYFTLAIIALNVWLFAGWQLRVGVHASVLEAGLIPAELAAPDVVPGVRHLFTYMFMHGGWLHLLGNMWFLWIFGRAVEAAIGSGRFLAFYLSCGVAAALCHARCAASSTLPLVGASGAISGVLGAYLVMFSRSRIITLIPIVVFLRVVAVPAWLFLLVWIGLQVLAQSAVESGQPAGVAYLAHIGGFVTGLALIFFYRPSRPPDGAARI